MRANDAGWVQPTENTNRRFLEQAVRGLISEQILEQIRQNNDVVEVIGSYFPLKHAGANFRALCPFHKEKTPSFNVNPQKQIWHCFGCGAGGDVFTFVMKYENLDFVAAVRRLAERAGIKLEYEERDGGPGARPEGSLLKLHELAANFFHHNLMKEPSAADRARVPEETQDHIRISRKKLAARLRARRVGRAYCSTQPAKKFPAELLETAGLALSLTSELAKAAMGFTTGFAVGSCSRSATSKVAWSGSAVAS